MEGILQGLTLMRHRTASGVFILEARDRENYVCFLLSNFVRLYFEFDFNIKNP
jgi:hypothetical protein